MYNDIDHRMSPWQQKPEKNLLLKNENFRQRQVYIVMLWRQNIRAKEHDTHAYLATQ